MKFKDVVISEASTEAKVAALAFLLDKELIKLADTVLNVKKLEGPKGEQGIQGPKGEQGDRGFDGTNGKDGADGKDGKDGEDGKQGVGVADAKIDFDGSLVITLTDGTEINAGDVVPLDTAEKIRVIGNGGGTSQSVLDAIDAINAIISTYGTMATQNANNVAITGGSVNGTTIGATTPAAGAFTTLTATGQTSLGGVTDSESLRVLSVASATRYLTAQGSASGDATLSASGPSGSNVNLTFYSRGTGSVRFGTNSSITNEQFRVSHTASAVNYVQVTGAATGSGVAISAQGSDSNINFNVLNKGTGNIALQTASVIRFRVNGSDGSVDSGISSSGGISLKSLPVASQVNYLQAAGNATGLAVQFSAQGSDTNISQVFQSKGTGAIDLAAGSSGVNISNGGTVTAITRTNGGSNYTSAPTVTISAPTTAGGVQATATVTISTTGTPTVTNGGTGYTVGDVLTISGGTPVSAAATLTVTTVSGGVITAASYTNFSQYTTAPSNPVSVTGGTGSGATFTISWGTTTTFTITNAGSGYVEQPTVSFSGGGGSGAAAYATVGSGTVVKSIGSTMDFSTPNGIGFRVGNSGVNNNNYIVARGASSNPDLGASAGALILYGGSGQGIGFYSNGYTNLQFNVAHTASAVNYVQVTGGATGGTAKVSAQGSDASVALEFNVKGSGVIYQKADTYFQNSSGNTQFAVLGTASSVNYLKATGSVAGAAPSLSAQGSDTNIDLALTPKGTGRVKFGTYTANMALTVQGYIEILDSGGTVRKLAVIA